MNEDPMPLVAQLTQPDKRELVLLELSKVRALGASGKRDRCW
jgi:hypothetical protein